MINFRYHVVSLIAVFLALAIGVIMGSAVIDRAIVDRLEDQQRSLEVRIDDVEAENDALRGENRDLRSTAEQLAEEGNQRLLAGTLTDVPVVVLATRGVESDGFDDLLSLLASSGADRRGTLWFTDRFALDDEEEQRDLATALDAPASLSEQGLRTLALTRLTTSLRRAGGTTTETSGSTTTTAPIEPAPDPLPADPDVLLALRDAGFVEFDPPEGVPDDLGPQLVAGTRFLLVSGPPSVVAIEDVSVPVAGLLVADRPGVPEIELLAAEHRAPADGAEIVSFTEPLRDDDEVADRLSTVDNMGDFAGRLAAVLALADLGEGRVGHYGRGPGADRLLPAPPE